MWLNELSFWDQFVGCSEHPPKQPLPYRAPAGGPACGAPPCTLGVPLGCGVSLPTEDPASSWDTGLPLF